LVIIFVYFTTSKKFMKKLQQAIVSLVLLSLSTFSLAQSDSTNLPGLSTSHLTTPTTTSGTGVPNAGDLSAVTTSTEMMVDSCPTTGGNGYGYYPNGAVPADGTANSANVNGGVIYESTVTTDRFGTTTYGGWTQVNFLCTAIPYPPGCPSGQTQTSAPYWDWGSNQWVGLTCANPVTAATQQAACGSASFGYNGQMTATNSMTIYSSITTDINTYAQYAFCWGGNATASGSNPGYSNTIYDTYSYELGVGTDPYGYGQRTATGGGMCWLQAGTNNVVAKTIFGVQKSPGTCH
jgi:hypothetical protein